MLAADKESVRLCRSPRVREKVAGPQLPANLRRVAGLLGENGLALPVPLNAGEDVAVIDEPLTNLLLVLDFLVDQGSHRLQDAIDLRQGPWHVREVAVLRTRVVDRDEGEDRIERRVRERERQHVRSPELQGDRGAVRVPPRQRFPCRVELPRVEVRRHIPRRTKAVHEARRHVAASATDLEAGRSRLEGEIRSNPFVDSRVAESAGPVHKEPRNPVHLGHRTLPPKFNLTRETAPRTWPLVAVRPRVPKEFMSPSRWVRREVAWTRRSAQEPAGPHRRWRVRSPCRAPASLRQASLDGRTNAGHLAIVRAQRHLL